jgi:hypothetical protein
MKRKYFFVILFLTLAIFLSGCGGVITPSTNLTGNWAITYTTTSGTPSFFDVGEVNNATCNIVDNNGLLTISDFTIIDQEYIHWEVGYGTFNKPAFTTGYLTGSYINEYEEAIALVIIFEGDINDDGTIGTGTWTANVSVNDVAGGNGSGTTIFTKE